MLAIFSAVLIVSSTSSAAGTTLLTRPISKRKISITFCSLSRYPSPLTQRESFSGIQVDRASEDHFHSLRFANGLDKTLSTTGTGNDTELDFRLSKDGLFTSIDDLF
jgi:hypothetical protein